MGDGRVFKVINLCDDDLFPTWVRTVGFGTLFGVFSHACFMIQGPPLLRSFISTTRPAMNTRGLIKFSNDAIFGASALLFRLEWKSNVVLKNAPVSYQKSLYHFKTFIISFITLLL